MDEKKMALVLMPFDSSYDDIYSNGVKPIFEKRGYVCQRMDEKTFSGQIVDEILRSILESDIIVAEMTDNNPNVLYEVGYAHGIGKQPILITKKADSLPFNVRGHNHIEYGGDINILMARLEKHLRLLDQTSSALDKINRNPTLLRKESKDILIHLYNANEERSAAECAERARGIFAVLNDLRFQGYVTFYGPLLPSTPIRLTESGRVTAKILLEKLNDS